MMTQNFILSFAPLHFSVATQQNEAIFLRKTKSVTELHRLFKLIQLLLFLLHITFILPQTLLHFLLVTFLDAVHDVEAENATENGAGDDSDVGPCSGTPNYHFCSLIFSAKFQAALGGGR